MRLLHFTLILLTAVSLNAQYIPNTDIPFSQYGSAMHTPLTGGLTAPQFSNIDVNGDGLNDLFIFDRGAWKSLILLRDETDLTLKYAPEIEDQFPMLEDWALIRDYNTDGVPDIFTYSLGSTAVYQGSMATGTLEFTLVKNELVYTDGPATTALYTSRTDIPSIDDIDGDGDLDILSFSLSNATIRFYQNMSMESGYGTDSLLFELPEFCWGELYEETSCDGAILYVVCKGGGDGMAAMQEELHAGSTIVTFDKDGDGDKDAIIGDNSCNNLVFYRNGGSSAYAQMTEKDFEFPSNSLSFSMPVFPSAFFVDVDDDGDDDLLATTNDHLLGTNLEQVWLYENLNTNDTFDLQFNSDTFLVSDMVDAGMYSKPVFFDHNSDGLLDILIGVGSSLGKDEILRHGMWLYANTGTAFSPAYTLVTTDYAGLNAFPINQLSPAPGDPDNDNDEDLVIGLSDGTLCFLENIAGPGAEAVYAAPVFNWQGIDIGQLASPFFIDIQPDGKPDLVVGEQNGNLNYFHNTGTESDPIFTLESENWGGVDVRRTGFITGYSAPFMYRNEHDSLYLLVGSQSGYVFEFNEIEDALLGEFYERDTNYLNWYPGTFTSVWGGDITGDGVMEYLIGTIRGGIQIFERDNGIDVQDQTHGINIELFPNPATDQITIHWPNSVTAPVYVEIYDMRGHLMFDRIITENDQQVLLPSGWPAGVYGIRLISSSGTGTGVFIRQ